MVTAQDLLLLKTIVQASSVLGILGVAWLLYFMILSADKFRVRTPFDRIVVLISASDLIAGLIRLFQVADTPDAFPCQLQGFFIQTNALAYGLTQLAMAYMVVYTVYLNGCAETLVRRERWWAFLCFLLPTLSGVLMLFWQPNGQRLIGNATLWCWIRPGLEFYRIVLNYGWIWIILGVNICTCAAVLYSWLSGHFSSQPIHGRYILRRMSFYMVVFMIVFIPSSISRVLQDPPLYITIMHAIVSPGRGLLHLIAFILSQPPVYYDPLESGTAELEEAQVKKTASVRTEHLSVVMPTIPLPSKPSLGFSFNKLSF
ncbi:hypothetical protein EDD86DRAFT_221501 [Gorgonomyces haynaldii]|nr:hypothetical protein EDD86DRAFT_221501 [Gorgonomyces haynaldii]